MCAEQSYVCKLQLASTFKELLHSGTSGALSANEASTYLSY